MLLLAIYQRIYNLVRFLGALLGKLAGSVIKIGVLLIKKLLALAIMESVSAIFGAIENKCMEKILQDQKKESL